PTRRRPGARRARTRHAAAARGAARRSHRHPARAMGGEWRGPAVGAARHLAGGAGDDGRPAASRDRVRRFPGHLLPVHAGDAGRSALRAHPQPRQPCAAQHLPEHVRGARADRWDAAHARARGARPRAVAAPPRGAAGGTRPGRGHRARAARDPGHPAGGGLQRRSPAREDALVAPRDHAGGVDRGRLGRGGGGAPMTRAAGAAFPRTVRGHPYCDLLYRTLAARGVALAASAELSPRWLLRHVREVKVLHLHWPEFYYRSGGGVTARSVTGFIAALLLARLLRYRVVWTVHNALPHERHVVDRALRWLLLRSARRVVHAEAARAALPQTRRPAAVVPHGHYIGCYPDELSAEDARRALGLALSDRVFVCFGQLRAYKGVGALLDAFARLPGQSLHLVIAGRPATDADAEAVHTAARRDARVQTHLEFVSDPDVQRFFKAADFAVLPYRDVLTSGAALLALSFARPLVVPRRGCLVELEHEGCAI